MEETGEQGGILWHRLAILLVSFFALPMAVTMTLAYAFPELTGWLVFGGIALMIVGWIAGGGAASNSRPRNYVVNARFTNTEQRYRIDAITGGASLMLALACVGIAMMVGGALGYQLSVTI